MRITKALDSEKEEIFNLIQENAQWINTIGITQWPLDWLENQRQNIYRSVAEGLFYSYSLSGTLAGVVELRSEPEALWGFELSSAVYIHKLAISRSYKGLGLGRSILLEIFSWAQNQSFNYVRLDCAASNHKLREYYSSLGFSYIRTESNGEIDLALFELPLHQVVAVTVV